MNTLRMDQLERESSSVQAVTGGARNFSTDAKSCDPVAALLDKTLAPGFGTLIAATKLGRAAFCKKTRNRAR